MTFMPNNLEFIRGAKTMPSATHTCSACKETKDASCFSAMKTAKTGLQSTCRECQSKWRHENIEKRREIARKYNQRKDVIERKRERQKKRDRANPGYRGASTALSRALMSGVIAKTPCVQCGSVEIVWAFKPDVTKPLEVIWLCPKHHHKISRINTSSRFQNALSAFPIGWRFGMLSVVGGPYQDDENSPITYEVQCDCGSIVTIAATSLISARKSCGCLRAAECDKAVSTHGATYSRLYGTWCGMKSRCHNPKNDQYPRYGGRGIKIDSAWRDDYSQFHLWAINNGYSDELTIERIDVHGDYCPSNCTWITRSEQALNKENSFRITAFGETKVAAEWARDARCKCSSGTLRIRIKQGVDPETAITKVDLHRVRTTGHDRIKIVAMENDGVSRSEIASTFKISQVRVSQIIKASKTLTRRE